MTRKLTGKTKTQKNCIFEPNVHLYGHVELAENVWLEPNVTIFGPVTVGKGTYIGPNCVIGFPDKKEIEQMLHKMDRETRNESNFTRIGESVQLRSNCVLYSNVILGNRVRFGHNVMVREDVKIGDDTLVGTNSTIDGNCRIGRSVSIQTNVYIPTNTIVEDHVFLGPSSVLTNDKFVGQTTCELRGPILRKGASIGGNATILPGIEIGEGAVVGAGAVVTKNVPPKVIVVGIPAMKLKDVPKSWGLSGLSLEPQG